MSINQPDLSYEIRQESMQKRIAALEVEKARLKAELAQAQARADLADEFFGSLKKFNDFFDGQPIKQYPGMVGEFLARFDALIASVREETKTQAGAGR